MQTPVSHKTQMYHNAAYEHISTVMHCVVVQAAGAGETALSTRLHRDTEFMRKSVRPFSTDLFLS